MKIVIVSTMLGCPWAGSEELWARMAAEALDAGHEVTVIAFRWPELPAPIARLRSRGARIRLISRRYLPGPDELTNRLLNLAVRHVSGIYDRLPRVKDVLGLGFRDIAGFQPDVICLSQGSPFDLADSRVGRELTFRIRTSGVPYVVVCQQNTDSFVPGPRYRSEVAQLYRRANAVRFVSEHNWHALERQVALALPEAGVVRNPVNLFDTSPVQWPEPAASVRFATVARLHAANKGQDVLLQVLGAREWRERPWRLRFYGTGPDREYLQSLASQFRIADRVEFAGHVADVRSIWNDNEILILPSRAEGTPLALVEAMLCARPAMVTDVGGNSEWIEDHVSGYVAHAPTFSSLSSVMERAWSLREQWQVMGQAAHVHATARIDPDPGKTLLRVILEAVARPAADVAQPLSHGPAST